jgi:hypothetical protein
MVGRYLAALLCTSAAIAAVSSRPARADEPQQFAAASGVSADALDQLSRGASIRRQSTNNTLTQDDRARLRGLGLGNLHASAVSLHKIPRRAGQMARLHALVHAVGGFSPSEACDGIVTEGDGTGLCLGSVDGPFGKVHVRMPVAAKLTENADGTLHLVISNHRPMEAQPLFGWSEIVAPGHLKVVYDMFPTDDGWLVYARVGVEMSAHEGSARTISDALLKLESWLTRELSRA